MKKLLMVLVIAVFGVVLTGNAMAIPAYGDLAVDFRTWVGADNQATWTVGNVTAASTPLSSTTLYQDNVDGLGVRPGELDEIDGAENLNVTFSGGMWLIHPYKSFHRRYQLLNICGFSSFCCC